MQTYSTQKYSDDGMELAVADADAGIAIGVSYADALNSLTATAHQTNYAYDGFGRLKKTTFADATHEDLTYDDGGNVLTRVNRSTQTLTYTYDHLDRMLTKNSPTGGSGTTTTWTYDLASQVTNLTDGATTIAATFDLAGRPLTSVQTLPGMSAKTVTYAYDNGAGDKLNRSRMTWPDGYYVDTAYNMLNQLTTATDSGSTVLASRTYDELARPATTQYPNSNDNIAYAWDAQDNLTTLTDNFTGSTADVSFTNTFTPAHQIADSTISKAAYRYTPAGSSTDTYTVNGLNQYGGVNGGTLTYDTRGNLTGDGAWTYSFDPENHMLTASKTSGGTVSAAYTYDPIGRRIAKSGTGVTATAYIHDGDSEIAEYDGSGALVRRFVPGPVIDQPIAMVTAAGTKTFFHTDKLGSVIAMSGTTGSRTEGPYLYDSYGNCATASGGACGTGVPYRYTGQRFDGETGLHYYRARYYSSKLGRFLQTDPIGYKDDLNWYMYAHDDPTDGTDPMGTNDNKPPQTASGGAQRSPTNKPLRDRPGNGPAARVSAFVNRVATTPGKEITTVVDTKDEKLGPAKVTARNDGNGNVSGGVSTTPMDMTATARMSSSPGTVTLKDVKMDEQNWAASIDSHPTTVTIKDAKNGTLQVTLDKPLVIDAGYLGHSEIPAGTITVPNN